MANGEEPMLSDEVLYQQVLQKSQPALTELIARYHVLIYRFLYRYTGDSALAEDITQETFIRLMKYRGVPPQKFKPWIYVIAVNMARDHFQSAQYRYELSHSEEGIEHIPDEGGLPEHGHDDVLVALAKLRPDQREVILLRFYHDLKLEEISEITDAPIGTVKSRLFHALKNLKAFLIVKEICHDRS
jgi:RNA polymerase sigma-70 factor, ECF subfamily